MDGSHPAGRYAGTLITDAERGRLLLFGGEAASGAKSDVWELVETAAPEEDLPEAEEPLESPAPEVTEHPEDA